MKNSLKNLKINKIKNLDIKKKNYMKLFIDLLIYILQDMLNLGIKRKYLLKNIGGIMLIKQNI